MRRELGEIVQQLRKWANKYNKNYISLTFIDGTTMAYGLPGDKDEEKMHFYIREDDTEEDRIISDIGYCLGKLTEKDYEEAQKVLSALQDSLIVEKEIKEKELNEAVESNV